MSQDRLTRLIAERDRQQSFSRHFASLSNQMTGQLDRIINLTETVPASSQPTEMLRQLELASTSFDRTHGEIRALVRDFIDHRPDGMSTNSIDKINIFLYALNNLDAHSLL